MRIGYPLQYFNGKSQSYVYGSVGDYVEDYGDDYEDNCSFIELIGSIVVQETEDLKYSKK